MQKNEDFFLIGIGGIGMSALARILIQKGHKVSGSDQKQTPILEALSLEGIEIHVGKNKEKIGASTVVYSTAIQESHEELKAAKQNKNKLLHRSEALQNLISLKQALVVTGTHGKTTTSSLLTFVLIEAKMDPSFALGGLLQSEKTNGRYGKGAYFVVEGDESDGSFLKTDPFGAIVTNFETEHMSYWKREEALFQAFESFFQKVQNEQHLFWCIDDLSLKRMTPKGISYGFSHEADLQITQFQQKKDHVQFDLSFQGKIYSEIVLSMNGEHNAQNGAAVFGLALSLGISEKVIRNAFLKFLGVKRRQEFCGEKRGVLFYDDYAHHPTEIKATLKALQSSRRLVALFQPHRATRLKDNWIRFLDSFERADVVILTDIYLAGESPIAGIDMHRFERELKEKSSKPVYYFPRDRLEKEAAQILRPLDLVVTLGAGDITKVIDPLMGSDFSKLKVALICGSKSHEHAISLKSAKNVHQNLDPEKYETTIFYISKKGKWSLQEKVPEKEFDSLSVFSEEVLNKLQEMDVAFPVLHGERGEDGMIQGFLETLEIPYVGCSYRSSSICMQKAWSKKIVKEAGVLTAPFFTLSKEDYEKDPKKALQGLTLSFPLYIKPVHLGSSIGVSRAETQKSLEIGIQKAFEKDTDLILEKEILGREVEFSILGNEVSSPAILMTGGAFYDYDKKYGKSPVQLEIPAKISEDKVREGKSLALKVFQLLGGSGLARVDFFLDDEGTFWFNEINPMPGFTNMSGYPKMWEYSGIEQKKLLDLLIIESLSRVKGKSLHVE